MNNPTEDTVQLMTMLDAVMQYEEGDLLDILVSTALGGATLPYSRQDGYAWLIVDSLVRTRLMLCPQFSYAQDSLEASCKIIAAGEERGVVIPSGKWDTCWFTQVFGPDGIVYTVVAPSMRLLACRTQMLLTKFDAWKRSKVVKKAENN